MKLPTANPKTRIIIAEPALYITKLGCECGFPTFTHDAKRYCICGIYTARDLFALDFSASYINGCFMFVAGDRNIICFPLFSWRRCGQDTRTWRFLNRQRLDLLQQEI